MRLVFDPKYKIDHLIYYLSKRMYRWSGYFGCQLESYEWKSVPAGTSRVLAGKEFTVSTCKREGLKYRVTWSISLDSDIDKSHQLVRELKSHLQDL